MLLLSFSFSDRSSNCSFRFSFSFRRMSVSLPRRLPTPRSSFLFMISASLLTACQRTRTVLGLLFSSSFSLARLATSPRRAGGGIIPQEDADNVSRVGGVSEYCSSAMERASCSESAFVSVISSCAARESLKGSERAALDVQQVVGFLLHLLLRGPQGVELLVLGLQVVLGQASLLGLLLDLQRQVLHLRESSVFVLLRWRRCSSSAAQN
ncbi:hypothetical protein EYF80_019829 [Liparis tanakae]|uniref:Uncharacterized protein n=1 Tax=Liparis tanakae TaxID=230148 RepID=A0A4Z2HVT2_9TELE|nr:hypothetical protein EYF80_019829 [Liparis tanakae]